MSPPSSAKNRVEALAEMSIPNGRVGILIPSPIMSHTHAIAVCPFDPNALLVAENKLIYTPEYAINRLPSHEQEVHFAGQSAVVQGMEKLIRYEIREQIFNRLPKVELQIHQNANANPIDHSSYWRKMLGWAGSSDPNFHTQQSRYTTTLPGQSELLQGVQDQYEWDYGLGRWEKTTRSRAQQACERRDWVCAELERIDSLRYDVMKDWEEKIKRIDVARLSRKRSRAEEASTDAINFAEQKIGNVDGSLAPAGSLKRHKTVNFNVDDDLFLEPAEKRPRQSIERPLEFLPLENPGGQTTKSSFSEVFSSSPDADHEARSQAPEPESPMKNDAPFGEDKDADFINRYSFVLEIPATDKQRLEWIEFLKTYRWNHNMIRSLKRFFLAEKTPTISQTVEFLQTLKAICDTIEEVSNGCGGEKKFRLLWNEKVEVQNFVVADSPKTPPPEEFRSPQPTWTSPPQFSSPSASDSESSCAPETVPRAAITVSTPVVRIQQAMKSYVAKLKKGDQVHPPCDRCKLGKIVCRINKTSCKTCADAHHKCIWSEAVPGLMDGESD